jgi:uncharacterized protein
MPVNLAHGRPHLAVRLSAVLVASLLIWLAMAWLADNVFNAWPANATHAASATFVFASVVPMVIASRRYIDRRPWAGLGLTGLREGWRPFVVGAVAWLVPGIAGLVLVSLGRVQITLAGSLPAVAATVSMLIVLVTAFEAFPEELIMRGHIQRNLTAAMPPWLAVVVQTLLFVVFGSVLWTVTAGWEAAAEQAVMFLGMGIVLGCIRVMTGNLWACIGYHVAFQTTAQLLLIDRHSVIVMDGPGSLELVPFAAAFAIGPAIVALMSPNEVNWRHREPDEVPAHADANQGPLA